MNKQWYLSRMSRAINSLLAEEVPTRLAQLVGVPWAGVRGQRQPSAGRGKPGSVVMPVRAGRFNFVVECRVSGQAATVAMAARSAKAFARQRKGRCVPLVAVSYMGEAGKRLCEEAGIGWLDLCGNAHLVAPGLRVNIEGKPNQFKRPGRPRNLFAPKSSRIARCLLMEPDEVFSQRELARTSGLDEGFTSRIVRQLEAERLVERDASGAVKVGDRGTMLGAWREVYDFSRHHIVRGHMAARSSDEVLRQLEERFKREKIEHAATGLAGAWLLNHFAGFRLVVFYVGRMPSLEVQQAMGFHEEQRGENVWLVVPNDGSVFRGATDREGIRCVHPVQVYLDLKDHPERSTEAAEQLRQEILKRGAHG